MNEFSCRHNQRFLNAFDKIGLMAAGFDGKRLPNAVLTCNTKLDGPADDEINPANRLRNGARRGV